MQLLTNLQLRIGRQAAAPTSGEAGALLVIGHARRTNELGVQCGPRQHSGGLAANSRCRVSQAKAVRAGYENGVG